MRIAATCLAFVLLVCRIGAQEEPARGAGGAAAPPADSRAPAIPPLPTSLEELLAIALRSNPEILKAEAKVRKAQADLNQVRLMVTREVITTFHERGRDMDSLEALESQLHNVRKMIDVGNVSQSALTEPILALGSAKARVAQGDAQLRYATGFGGSLGAAATAREAGDSAPVRKRPELSREYEALLSKTVSVDFTAETANGFHIGRTITALSGGKFNLLGQASEVAPALSRKVPADISAKLSDVPLKTVLIAIADHYDLCFVFRDYGVLVLRPDRAATMFAPCIPAETPLRLDAPAQQ